MASTTLWFESVGPVSNARRPFSRRAWTCIGALAVPLWATWPALALRTFEMPAFECLAVMFLVGCVSLIPLERGGSGFGSGSGDSARSVASPWLTAVVFALGASGADSLFILATHHIPAAQANLIAYLWPVMIVGFGSLMGLFRLRLRQGFGLGLGFAGAVILMQDGRLSLSPAGMLLALLSGACWALYCLYRLQRKQQTGHILARGCALSALLCAVIHFSFEPTVIPGWSALAAAAAAVAVPLALGNYVWDQGFRHGDSQLLAVMAYATPLCSALLLAALGLALFTPSLAIGAVVIVFAGWLARSET
jgi:drug/metabolite transporter (DMT)-like permease